MMSRALLERLTALDWAGGQQALLIINRRGLASALLCRDCGAAQSCPSCERPLVLHSAGSLLRCHGCGIAAEPLTRCPSCGGARIRALGGGTERLEAEVRTALPDLIVDRLDGMPHRRSARATASWTRFVVVARRSWSAPPSPRRHSICRRWRWSASFRPTRGCCFPMSVRRNER